MAEPDRNAVLLVALLAKSNEAGNAKDPFTRRMVLNEIDEGIQANREHIEALAEGLMFLEDDT